MKKNISALLCVFLFVISVSTYADNTQYNTRSCPSANSNALSGDLYCPSGQRVVGIHQKCATTGCGTDYLHCA